MADNKYAALLERLRDGTGLPVLQALMTEAADTIEALAADRRCAIPAADVVEAKRGKWIPDYDYAEYDYDGSTPLPEPLKFQDGWQCSLCGEYTPGKTNYCPNCGAWMEES